MSKKTMTAALAGILATGIATPAFATGKTNLDDLNKAAYNATIKAKELKTQAAVNKAREAIKAFRMAKPDSEYIQNMANTYSVEIDAVQQPILTKIVNTIKAAQAETTQANVNAAFNALPIELMDLEGTSDFDYWMNAYNSYKVAIDTLQQDLNDVAFNAVKKAEASKLDKDIADARELVKELKTSVRPAVVAFAEKLDARLDAIQPIDDKEVVREVKNAKTELELTAVLEKYAFAGVKKENGNYYLAAKNREAVNLDSFATIQKLVVDAGNKDAEGTSWVGKIVNAPTTTLMVQYMKEAGIEKVNTKWANSYNTNADYEGTIIGNAKIKTLSQIQTRVYGINKLELNKTANNDVLGLTDSVEIVDALINDIKEFHPEVVSQDKNAKLKMLEEAGVQRNIAVIRHADKGEVIIEELKALDNATINSEFNYGANVNEFLAEDYVNYFGAKANHKVQILTTENLEDLLVKTNKKVAIDILNGENGLYNVVKELKATYSEADFNRDEVAKDKLAGIFAKLHKSTGKNHVTQFTDKTFETSYWDYVIAITDALSANKLSGYPDTDVQVLNKMIAEVNGQALANHFDGISTENVNGVMRRLKEAVDLYGLTGVTEANKAHYYHNSAELEGDKIREFGGAQVNAANSIVTKINNLAVIAEGSSTVAQVKDALLSFVQAGSQKSDNGYVNAANAVLKSADIERLDIAELLKVEVSLLGDKETVTLDQLENEIVESKAGQVARMTALNNVIKEMQEAQFVAEDAGNVAELNFDVLQAKINAIPGMSVNVIQAENFYNNAPKQADDAGTPLEDESRLIINFTNFTQVRNVSLEVQ